MLIKGKISIVYFLKLIQWDIAVIVLYAIVVGTLDHLLFFKGFDIPLGISALVGTLLSLLLAFRTSQSYERWWEARNIWGAIVNDSRTLIRQLMLFLPDNEEKKAVLQDFAERQYTWCYVLTSSLRRIPFEKDVQDYLKVNNMEGENLPNRLLTGHTEALHSLRKQYNLDPNVVVQLDSTLQRLTDSQGACERIKNTIFPRSYSLLIHFLIYVLMSILPFGLEDEPFFLEIALSSLIPILFIMIERTAIIMQDPFDNRPTDTPMTSLSQTIERNLKEMSGAPKPNQPSPNGTFYIL